MTPTYKRVLLKVSGEALMGDRAYGLDNATVKAIAQDIKDAVALGVQVALVIGGGNIFRGMEKGRVVIFAAGTGNPFFTTDTAAALRAAEMGCDALLKGTQVDGVYDSDPRKNPDAQRYTTLSYLEMLARDLAVMDAAAISVARENHLPIIVFNIHEAGAFTAVMQGQGRYTTVTDAA